MVTTATRTGSPFQQPESFIKTSFPPGLVPSSNAVNNDRSRFASASLSASAYESLRLQRWILDSVCISLNTANIPSRIAQHYADTRAPCQQNPPGRCTSESTFPSTSTGPRTPDPHMSPHTHRSITHAEAQTKHTLQESQAWALGPGEEATHPLAANHPCLWSQVTGPSPLGSPESISIFVPFICGLQSSVFKFLMSQCHNPRPQRL